MKRVWITLTLGLLTLAAVLGQENDDYEYEDEVPAAPQPVQPRGRPPLLSSRQSKAIPLNSNNKIKSAGGKATPGSKQAAATKAPAPVQEEQDEYEDEYDQAPEEPVEVTSTEAPKKTIKPTVRPFRSNDDLLAALKRRRQQVQNTGGVVDKTSTTTSSTTSAPSSSHKKGSNSFNGGGRRGGRVSNGRAGQSAQATETVADEAPPAESPKKSPQSRRFNNRSGSRGAQQPIEEERAVEQEQPAQPVAKPKFGRAPRRPVA